MCISVSPMKYNMASLWGDNGEDRTQVKRLKKKKETLNPLIIQKHTILHCLHFYVGD